MKVLKKGGLSNEGMTKMVRKYFYTFEAGEVDKWKYCPKCGAEILEVYPGDYFGHITCFGEEDTCDINFEVTYREAED